MTWPDDYINKVICGDCLEVMKSIPDKSVDAVITDLPYGTTACSWDEIIPFEPMWAQVNRRGLGSLLVSMPPPMKARHRRSPPDPHPNWPG